MNSPCFVLERSRLIQNLQHLKALSRQTGIKWLYTLKAFDASEGLETIADLLDGFSIGNMTEAGKVAPYPESHLHCYAPAFHENEIETLAQQSHTFSVNSLTQWKRFAPLCREHTSMGLRINPRLSLKQPSYCDCNDSRLGVDYQHFLKHYQTLEGVEGLHFHPFCHQGADAIETLLLHIETHYTPLLSSLKWLNLGGGQEFTSQGYDTARFISLINTFQERYPNLTLYFEPGTAVLHRCGHFVCKIMDIIPHEETPIVILNTSIESHLLDIAITKHTPVVRNTNMKSTPYRYTLSGMSCIAGDTIGTYFFNQALHIGEPVIFENMLGYTMVKQTRFNGLAHASFKIIE